MLAKDGKCYTFVVPSLHIIYASTSGHTEYVIEKLVAFLKGANAALSIETQRVELTKPEDLVRGDVLLLASGTWNTGSIEGQLNPHMHDFLKVRAKAIDLKGKPVALIALGDERYRYTCGSLTHLEEFVHGHGGVILGDSLRIMNEPYGQEAAVESWGKNLLPLLK